MKLKNKLLPFIAFSTLTATIAPIALTSCTSESKSNAIDLRDWYTPTIEKHAFDTLTFDETTNLYFRGDEKETHDWMDEDKMIERLTQDYLFGSSLYVQTLQNSSQNLNVNQVNNYARSFTRKQTQNIYFNLLGVDGIVNAASPYLPVAGEFNLSSNYTKYDITISNVRVTHMTNYYDIENIVEYPTISFELGFDVSYNGVTVNNSNTPIGFERNDGSTFYLGQDNSIDTVQNHKGSIVFTNVPICLQYTECSEIGGAYAWTLLLDLKTIIETEMSSKVPFSVTAVDNISYETTTSSSGGSNQQSGTRVVEYDYYSNMVWRNQVDDEIFDSNVYEEYMNKSERIAKEYAAQKGWGPEVTEAYVAAEKYKADRFFVLSGRDYNDPTLDYVYNGFYGAVYNTIGEVNQQFFYTISYYLFSIACQ